MIRYTVLWDEAVEAQFLDAWIKSDGATRTVLTEIANLIDSTLRHDPESKGAGQTNSQVRGLIVQVAAASISVFFEVQPDQRQVRVVRLVFRRKD